MIMESDGITMPKCAKVCPGIIELIMMTDRKSVNFFMKNLLCPQKKTTKLQYLPDIYTFVVSIIIDETSY